MHDRKLLLEVREMVLDLTHHGRRASPKGGAAAAGAAAATLQQEAVALAAQLERKLDDFKGSVAELQKLERERARLDPLGC